jgi:hypothetical protein
VKPEDLITWASFAGSAAFCLIVGIALAFSVASSLFNFDPIALWRERCDRRMMELEQREETALAEAEAARARRPRESDV